MRARTAAALALAGAAALAGTPARAELLPRTMRLDLVRAPGAEECPDAAAFRDAVAVAAAVDPFETAAPARLVVTLMSSSSLARGRWELFDADGVKLRERIVTVSGSCRQLVQELALTFVVAYETPGAAPACAPDEACRAKIRAELRDEVRREILAEGYRLRMDLHPLVMAGGLLSAGLTADPGRRLLCGGRRRRGDLFGRARGAHPLSIARRHRRERHLRDLLGDGGARGLRALGAALRLRRRRRRNVHRRRRRRGDRGARP